MSDWLALLTKTHRLTEEDASCLLQELAMPQENLTPLLCQNARQAALNHFQNLIYTRGLIEFTNYCKNDCYYCGIRRSNRKVNRYRLTKEEILACCHQGYPLGFRTFVLQGGEDPGYSEREIAAIITAIKKCYPDCAVTLSIGEKPREVYEMFFQAGADRYLLRHETADKEHYQKLHPPEMSWQRRIDCLWQLKDIGFQVGAGFMVGSPGQTKEHLIKDLLFLQKLQPAMIGIGPFLSQKDTPFAQQPNGTLKQTIQLLAILRLLFPDRLIPATTALATVDPTGREQGILAGANVVMPNLSPLQARQAYQLYDHKASLGAEAAQGWSLLENKISQIGYHLTIDRGDFRPHCLVNFEKRGDEYV